MKFRRGRSVNISRMRAEEIHYIVHRHRATKINEVIPWSEGTPAELIRNLSLFSFFPPHTIELDKSYNRNTDNIRCLFNNKTKIRGRPPSISTQKSSRDPTDKNFLNLNFFVSIFVDLHEIFPYVICVTHL